MVGRGCDPIGLTDQLQALFHCVINTFINPDTLETVALDTNNPLEKYFFGSYTTVYVVLCVSFC